MSRRHVHKMPIPAQYCQGKRRYHTQQQAEEVKEEQELLHPGLVLRTYACIIPGCKGWHLTRHTQQDNVV